MENDKEIKVKIAVDKMLGNENHGLSTETVEKALEFIKRAHLSYPFYLYGKGIK